MERVQAYAGIRPIFKGIWFAHGAPYGPPTPVGAWPVTPAELSGPSPQAPPVRIGHTATIPVFQWPGGGAPTALVLGPSSWGFGIGPWGGTAVVVPQARPTHVMGGTE